MNHTSLYANTSIVQILAPAVINSDTATTGVDLQNCDDVVLVADIGNSADTLSGSNYIEVEMQESDTDVDGDYTACANADVTNYVTGTNTGTLALINAAAEDTLAVSGGYKGSKRYIRLKFNFTGTHSTGTPIGALSLRGRLRAQPANSYT
jgi:hypothetical protein